MKPSLIFSVIAICAGVAALPAAAQRPVQFPVQAQPKRYHVEGTVIALRPAARQLVLDARAIPGYMSAMTMPFAVRDTIVFSQVKPGDVISGDLVLSAGASWLENVATATPAEVAGPQVDTMATTRRDSARPPRDSIGIKPPSVDSIVQPNTLRDSTALRYPPR